jgi:hypothetical protein
MKGNRGLGFFKFVYELLCTFRGCQVKSKTVAQRHFLKKLYSVIVVQRTIGQKHIMVAKNYCHKYWFSKLCDFQLSPSQY